MKMWKGKKELDTRGCSEIKGHNEEVRRILQAKKKTYLMTVFKLSERPQADNDSFDSLVMDLKILVKDFVHRL